MKNVWESYKRCFLPTAEIKDYNIGIFGRNFFWKPNKHDLRTYNNIQNIATGQVDDFTTGCLLDYPYFKEYCQLIATDLSKQLKLDADPKAI